MSVRVRMCVCTWDCWSADTSVSVTDGAHGHVHVFAVCARDCVVGAGDPTEGQLGSGDHLLSPGAGAAQGHEFSWRPGQGLPKDQSPSSGNFSHLQRLPRPWRQLEISGVGGMSQRVMCELLAPQTNAP